MQKKQNEIMIVRGLPNARAPVASPMPRGRLFIIVKELVCIPIALTPKGHTGQPAMDVHM